MNKFIPEKIANMKEYTPDTNSYKIRLDANESPYPTPSSIQDKLKNIDFSTLNRYPDPYATKLISAYGKIVGVAPEKIVAGVGSDEIISLIVNTFLTESDSILVFSPDFSMYAFYSELKGSKIVTYEKKDLRKIDFDEVEEMVKSQKIKLVIFSNPCNPVGSIYNKEEILSFLSKTDALVVVDEAYMEFSPRSESVIDQIDNFENLLVLKTVSKLGFAAMRCGFALSNSALISALRKTKSPYNLNTFTQEVITIVLENFGDVSAHVAEIKAQNAYLFAELQKLSKSGNFTLQPTYTNFNFLTFSRNGDAAKVKEYLALHSIAVRQNGKNNLRITSGTPSENQEFLRVFTECIQTKL